MTAIWFLILVSVATGNNGGSAFQAIQFLDKQACETALQELTKTSDGERASAICVPDRTQN